MIAYRAPGAQRPNSSGDIITQFGFDAEAVTSWIEQVRSRGIQWQIRGEVPESAGSGGCCPSRDGSVSRPVPGSASGRQRNRSGS
ncbi:hypothetical protein AB0G20_24650 [Streptomyces sp. NPDC024017]|uniref:hypothetical protein n=1 Tax=Streptomyces sp. NPDC024017 TaxID=3154326 RepID=UPI003410529D